MSMNLSQLKPGMQVKTRMMINPIKASNWKHAATNGSVGGGLMPGALLTVTDVSPVNRTVTLELPGRSPPAFLVLTGEELAMNFDMVGSGGAPAPKTAQPSLLAVFQKLSKRQMIAGEGLKSLQEARKQLKEDIAAGRFWGGVGVVANALLLPLNVILNAFEVGAATSIYQQIVKEAYAKFAKSGTRIDASAVKTGLGLIKKATVETLKKKGLTHYVPGVNILVGVAEDGFALFEVASTVSEGSDEMRRLLRQLDAKIAESYNAYIKIGIEMDRLLTEIQRRARTA